MRYLWVLLATFLPFSVGAQQSLDSCMAAFNAVSDVFEFETMPTYGGLNLDQDACLISDLRGETNRIVVTIERLRFKIEGDVAGALARERFLDHAEFNVEGLRYFAKTGLLRFDYVYEAIAQGGAGITARLSVAHADGAVSVEQLQINFDPLNSVTATMRIGNVATSDLGTATIEEMALEVVTHGLFERMVLSVVADALLGGDDPWAEAERLRAEALTWVAALPTDRQTRRDMMALVQDLPNPAGRVTLRFEGALSLQDVLSERYLGEQSFWAQATLRYTPPF